MSKSEPRLYLMLPAAFAPAALAPRLEDALKTGEIASVLMWLSEEDDAPWQQAAAALLPIVHGHGTPLLVGGDGERARRLGADGVHLETDTEELRAAHKALAPQMMVGAGGLASRHEAMLAAEIGVDYVFFGSADPARERPIASATVRDLTEWWSGLFQVPCIALAGSSEEAEVLAAVGADFLAVGEWLWAEPAGPALAIKALTERLKDMAVAP
jgi:thiamine-phosphate pyrophosphorylase